MPSLYVRIFIRCMNARERVELLRCEGTGGLRDLILDSDKGIHRAAQLA